LSGRFDAITAPTVAKTRVAMACATSKAAFDPAICPRFKIDSTLAPAASAATNPHRPQAKRRPNTAAAGLPSIEGDCDPAGEPVGRVLTRRMDGGLAGSPREAGPRRGRKPGSSCRDPVGLPAGTRLVCWGER